MRIAKNEVAGDRIISQTTHVETVGGSGRPLVLDGLARLPCIGGSGSADQDVVSREGTCSDRVARLNASVPARPERGQRIESPGGLGLKRAHNAKPDAVQHEAAARVYHSF